MAENLKKDGKEEKKKGGMSPDLKWLALGFGFAVTTVGATFLGVHFYVSQFMLAKAKMVAEEQAKEAAKKHVRHPGPLLPLLNTQIVNLKGGRFLKFSVSLQFLANDALWPPGGGGSHGAKKADPLEKYMPFFKDTTIETIVTFTADDLKNEAGRSSLRKKIKDNINSQMKKLYGPLPTPKATPKPEGEETEAHGEEHGGGGGGDEHHGPEPLPEVINVFFTEFVVS
ncbi:MAG: flagellar basal body-associated FliL family protein [Candidatus Sericytochromatia bacterium]|nr:flagellar basal body-associated FliL family protein [Candidatus Sericytochromatia bacterium]